MFFWVVCDLNAQMATKVSWDYPVKPGSEEWRMTSYAEKVEKSQPPKELMDRWDTETLFKYCVDYPFNHVTLMFNNPNDGFKRAYEQATVWQEFIHRNNALDFFAKYFEIRPYKKIFNMNDIEARNEELFTLYFLEKLVSETDFTTYLDSSQKRKLMYIILESHQSKKDYPHEFIGFHYNSSLSALLKILECDNVIYSSDEISLTKFREKTGNEYFIDERMDTAITTKVLYFLNE